MQLVDPKQWRRRNNSDHSIERPDRTRCPWCNKMDYSLTEAPCVNCEWEPPRISATSLSGKAIHKRRLTEAQEEGERIAVNGKVFAKHIEEKYLGHISASDGTSHSDVEARLAQATTQFRQLYWMWNDDRIGIKHKIALYVQFVQVATYGAEAWQLDDDIESRIRQWNAYNLATITTGGTAPGEGNQRWVQRLKQQQIAPAYNLI
eukprot:COSAG02_NODE_22687_length_743_cov_1.590062_2_plen_204_part_01